MSSTYEETKTSLDLLIASRVTRIARSPVFSLIRDIMANPTDLLFADLQLTNPVLIAGNSAYLLYVPDTVDHTPILDTDLYVLKERHFRIDQVFKTNTSTHHGLTPIHYTETYRLLSALEDDTQDIVIHVYLTKTGLFFYIDCPISLNKTQIDCLKANVERFKKIIIDLIEKNDKSYLKQKAIVKKIEEELSALSHSLNTVEQLKAYIKKANIFIQEIRILNQYTESDDPREFVTQNTVDALEKRILHYEAIANKSETVECNFEEDKKETCETSPRYKLEDPIKDFIRETVKTLTNNLEVIPALVEKYKKMCLRDPNIEDIITDYSSIETIRYYELLLSLPKGIKNEDVSNITTLSKKIETEIKIFDTYILNCLAMSARGGNPLVFESLFTLFENRLPESFYTKLLEALINCAPGMKKNNIMTVCEFLNTYSLHYKQVLLNMCNESIYETSEDEFEGTSLYKTQEKSFFDCIFISLLFKIYLKDDFDTFNMLLKQGANSNTWGLKNKESHLKVRFTLIYAIGSYTSKNYGCYIEALIACGANPNLRNHQSTLIHNCSKKLQISLTDKKIKQLTNGKMRVKSDDTDELSELLVLVIQSCRTPVVSCLLPPTNIQILTIALAEVFNSNLFNNRLLPSNKPFVEYANNLEMANQICPPQSTLSAQPFIGYLFYPALSLNSEKKEIQEAYTEYFKSLHQCLMEKLSNPKLTKTEFDQAYNELFDKGRSYQYDKNNEKSHRFFQSCDFLITLKASLLPTLKEKISFMKDYIPTLGPHLVSTCTLLYQKHNIPTHKPFLLDLRNQAYPQSTTTVILSSVLDPEEKKLNLKMNAKKPNPKK